MMIIVSLEQYFVTATQAQAKVRPFKWVSAQDAELDDVVERLQRHAARDMNFSVRELEQLDQFVREADATGQKVTYFSLEKGESLRVEIRTDEEQQAHSDRMDKLLRGK